MRRRFAAFSALSGGFGRLAWQGDMTIGFVLARDLGDECEILSLGVVPESREQGVGRALLRAVIDEAERQGRPSAVLEVAADNAAARALYARAGFVAVGHRPRYYRRAGEGRRRAHSALPSEPRTASDLI